MFGWSVWPAEMLFWLKSHCYYVTLGSLKSTCPSPTSSKRTTRPVNGWLVHSQSFIFLCGRKWNLSGKELRRSQGRLNDKELDLFPPPPPQLSLSCVPFLLFFLSTSVSDCRQKSRTSRAKFTTNSVKRKQNKKKKNRNQKLLMKCGCRFLQVTFKGPLG